MRKLIEVKQLRKNVDEIGLLGELLRQDWEICEGFIMAYCSIPFPGLSGRGIATTTPSSRTTCGKNKQLRRLSTLLGNASGEVPTMPRDIEEIAQSQRTSAHIHE